MKKILFFLIVFVSLVSCNKFLKEEPFSFLSTTNFYKNEGDAEAALNGAFSAMQAQTYYGRTSWLITELSGDALTTGANPTADRTTLNNYTATGSNGEVANWWRNLYQLINRTNEVIQKVPAINFDAKRKNNILGNARFLRALAYFELVRSFGEVPLVTTPTNETTDLKPKKATLATLYKQMIEDLIFAEGNCFREDSIVATKKGRVSKGAAGSILAKVYLTKGTTTAAEPSDYDNALQACNRVIDSRVYGLLPNYVDLFNSDRENTREHIFSIQFDAAPSIGNIILRMLIPAAGRPGGAGSFVVVPRFGMTYTVADSIRRTVNQSNTIFNGTMNVTTPLYFSKFKDATWGNQSNNSRVNWLITRYADVLLMQSEALYRINANDPNRFNGINLVRARVMPGAANELNATNTPTPESFVAALVNERGWELCMEGHRRWDLIRLGSIRQVIQTIKNIDTKSNNPLLPIPDNEKALNPNL